MVKLILLCDMIFLKHKMQRKTDNSSLVLFDTVDSNEKCIATACLLSQCKQILSDVFVISRSIKLKHTSTI